MYQSPTKVILRQKKNRDIIQWTQEMALNNEEDEGDDDHNHCDRHDNADDDDGWWLVASNFLEWFLIKPAPTVT